MTVTRPEPITYIGSPFYGPRVLNGKTYSPQAIVLHIMEGTLAGTDAWFNDPKAQVSAHFGVGKDGTIHQYIYESNAAWANGVIEPGASAGILAANNWQNPNLYTLSIEHEGKSGDGMTGAQLVASTKLAAWLFATFMPDVPINSSSIIRHAAISPKSRANCPGYSDSAFSNYVSSALLAWQLGAAKPAIDVRLAQARQLLDDVIAGR